MADLKYYDIILTPVLSEKSMGLMENLVYTFYVHPEANKAQIKEAVEKMFEGTKVAKVNTMNIPGKFKRRNVNGKLTSGYARKRKKAIVTLAEGSKEITIYKGL